MYSSMNDFLEDREKFRQKYFEETSDVSIAAKDDLWVDFETRLDATQQKLTDRLGSSGGPPLPPPPPPLGIPTPSTGTPPSSNVADRAGLLGAIQSFNASALKKRDFPK